VIEEMKDEEGNICYYRLFDAGKGDLAEYVFFAEGAGLWGDIEAVRL